MRGVVDHVGANMAKETFDLDKARVLHGKQDLSRKGSIDRPIADLVEYINSQDNYYTTSSCSGRILVFLEVRIIDHTL